MIQITQNNNTNHVSSKQLLSKLHFLLNSMDLLSLVQPSSSNQMWRTSLPTQQNYLNRNNLQKVITTFYPVGIYMFKVNNRNTRTRCEICSKLTIKTSE